MGPPEKLKLKTVRARVSEKYLWKCTLVGTQTGGSKEGNMNSRSSAGILLRTLWNQASRAYNSRDGNSWEL